MLLWNLEYLLSRIFLTPGAWHVLERNCLSKRKLHGSDTIHLYFQFRGETCFAPNGANDCFDFRCYSHFAALQRGMLLWNLEYLLSRIFLTPEAWHVLEMIVRVNRSSMGATQYILFFLLSEVRNVSLLRS